MKTFFGVTSKKGFICFFANVGRRFCPDLQGFCPDFQRFCPNVQGFCPDFQQIKTFGGALAPPAPQPPTPLTVVLHEIRSFRLVIG